MVFGASGLFTFVPFFKWFFIFFFLEIYRRSWASSSGERGSSVESVFVLFWERPIHQTGLPLLLPLFIRLGTPLTPLRATLKPAIMFDSCCCVCFRAFFLRARPILILRAENAKRQLMRIKKQERLAPRERIRRSSFLFFDGFVIIIPEVSLACYYAVNNSTIVLNSS
jgi:hypothetical protein